MLCSQIVKLSRMELGVGLILEQRNRSTVVSMYHLSSKTRFYGAVKTLSWVLKLTLSLKLPLDGKRSCDNWSFHDL